MSFLYLHAYHIFLGNPEKHRKVWYAHTSIQPGDGCDRVDVYRIPYQFLSIGCKLDSELCESLIKDCEVVLAGSVNQLHLGDRIRVVNHKGRTYTATVAESEPKYSDRILCRNIRGEILVKLRYGVILISEDS